MKVGFRKKAIGIRVLALLLIGSISVWIYNRYIWPLDRYEHAYFLEQLHGANDTCDLIYIGESSNFWSNKDSGDIREISKMLEHKTGRKVLNLSKSAYHIGIYQPIFDHFKDLKQLNRPFPYYIDLYGVINPIVNFEKYVNNYFTPL